jgi:ABC-2 type transport system ATP-binding protein
LARRYQLDSEGLSVQITLEDVVVRLGRRDVLKGLTWKIPALGRTLLLGRNGAGKTTTLRLMSGAIAPKSGRVAAGGRTAAPKVLRREVALMPQDISAVPGLTALEQVAFAGWLAGRAEADARAAAAQAIERVGLGALKNRKPSTLSGGELRRVGLAEALARPAELLLLDEPTAGLDPVQRARFRDLLLAIDRPTVVSTHQLDDVDGLFTSVAVLEGGQIVYCGTTEDFLAQGRGSDTVRRAESAFVTLTGQS